MKKRIVVLTGAGMSQESGLRTFREMGGLWEQYRVEEVASPQAWVSNMDLVLQFYNERRKQLLESEPNAGHKALARLEDEFDVRIVTQNVDDLHERAGSTHVMHLHGELRKARSTADPSLVYGIEGWELKQGDTCEKGSQLRPHIVWFGESVPMIVPAAELVATAHVLIIIGTSMNVYPAAGLVNYAPYGIPIYFIDPHPSGISGIPNLTVIAEKAGTGVQKVVDLLMSGE